MLVKQAKLKSDLIVKFITLHYFSFIQVCNKQLLDGVFVIYRIIKVEVMVISRSRRVSLIISGYKKKTESSRGRGIEQVREARKREMKPFPFRK